MFKLLPILKKFIIHDLTVNKMAQMNFGDHSLPVEVFKTKFKTIAVKALYDMKTLYHDVAVTSIIKSSKVTGPSEKEDNTPIDDPNQPLKELKKLYYGKSEHFNLLVNVGEVMAYEEIGADRRALSYKNSLSLKGSYFIGVVYNDTKNVVMSFYDCQDKYYFEVDINGKNLH